MLSLLLFLFTPQRLSSFGQHASPCRDGLYLLMENPYLPLACLYLHNGIFDSIPSPLVTFSYSSPVKSIRTSSNTLHSSLRQLFKLEIHFKPGIQRMGEYRLSWRTFTIGLPNCVSPSVRYENATFLFPHQSATPLPQVQPRLCKRQDTQTEFSHVQGGINTHAIQLSTSSPTKHHSPTLLGPGWYSS